VEYQFLPSLSLDEYEALRESIREKGVIEAVITDENGNIIDGHHRVKACAELGIEYPTRVIEGLSEEEKQDLSLELNMHRRHLTKEQKKELAVGLREQGWTQERIGKSLGVCQKTISNWVGLVNLLNQNSDKSTPTQNLDAIINAKVQEHVTQLEAKAAEQMKAAQMENQRLCSELNALKSAPKPEPVIIEKEKPVPSMELDEVLRKKESELEAMRRKLEEKEGWVDAKLKVEREQRESHFKQREADLQKLLEKKMQEIDAAAKAGVDVQELSKQKEALSFDILKLKDDLSYETRIDGIRGNFRKLASGAVSALQMMELLKGSIAQDPIYCRLRIDELQEARDTMQKLNKASSANIEILEEMLDKTRREGGLRVV